MKYNFDEIIDRKNTNSIKYDFAVERGLPEDILPLWVADMDFRSETEIIERLKIDVEHGIYGYSDSKEEYFSSLANWLVHNFDWQVQKDWLVKTPGIVFAMAAAIRAYTNEGDGVLIQEPVYYPFRMTIEDNDRKVVNNPLVLKEGHYEIDFEDFENKIIEEQVKLFIFCSPHNPVGRVWKEWELKKIGEICLKYNVIVFSDEIHFDFVYPGNKHFIFSKVDPRFEDISIIGTAPSKTFNLPGLQASNIFVSNRDLRKKLIKAIKQTGYSQLNKFGLSACEAAYQYGAGWLDELKSYLKENLDYLREYLKENLPQIKLVEPEGTYLVWLDCRELGLSDNEREKILINKAKLWISRGKTFGVDGEGFERINIACPRVVLKEALERLNKAFN